MKVDIEHLLARVTKPGRYTGGEWNSVTKDWDAATVRIALAYPDLYDIGMSNMGLGILYGLLNDQDDVLCERAFAPWPDMEAEMRPGGRTPLEPRDAPSPARIRCPRLHPSVRTDLHEHPQYARSRGYRPPLPRPP